MNNALHPNVYRLPQKDFEVIPGNPWVYWANPTIQKLFTRLPNLDDMSSPVHGTTTYDNARFLRFWWEIELKNINRMAKGWEDFETSNSKYVPYMKGGTYTKWYGNQEYVLQLVGRGKAFIEFLASNRDRIRGQQVIFKSGVTWTDLGASGFSGRICPEGFIFDTSGPCAFPDDEKKIRKLLAVMNSSCSSYILGLLNPTLHFQVGDLARLPIPEKSSTELDNLVITAIWMARLNSAENETTYDFIMPLAWETGLQGLEIAQSYCASLETRVDEEIYHLYDISDKDRVAIKSELAGGLTFSYEDELIENQEELQTAENLRSMTLQELSVRWISFAVGVVLGRFQPGIAGALGSAIYRQADFAIGSLPAPDEAEFDELVGSHDRFAYVDAQGGRHVFSTQIEQALQALALPDGIAVLDADHPRDLAKPILQVLELMLGEMAALEVIQTGAGGDLRKFLEKDFFTAWHFKWYRKRPVYWPIQSSKRSYGFVLFHEKITHETFYAIQREPYLDTKRNAVTLKIADLQEALVHSAGANRKKAEKELDEQHKLADELAEFAKDLEAITLGGYEPQENWIDDGVILRMAPLWKVVPVWKSEPKKYWERLEAGDFDWSHIAMKYWPERVRQKCKQDKSFAIAHGHEEWYQG